MPIQVAVEDRRGFILKKKKLEVCTSATHGKSRRQGRGSVGRTVLRDLSGSPLQQQPRSSSSGFDQLYRSGVRHVPRAFPIDLNDLISYLPIKEKESQAKMARFRDCPSITPFLKSTCAHPW